MELCSIWAYSSSVIQVYSYAGNSINFYFIFLTFCCFASKTLNHVSKASHKQSLPFFLIFIEIFGLKMLKKFGPDLKAARMISSIVLFIGSFALILTSFGSGMITCLIAVSICISMYVSNVSTLFLL